MSTIQSSPIERAAWLNKWVLIGYIGTLVFVALMTFFSWWAGSHLQGLIQKDADARIKEADSRAAVALENAGKANERAGLANAEASRANERAENLEQQNLTLRSQVAALETAASEAKTQLAEQQGRTASLEKAAAEAKAAQQRVETDLAKQQERAAKAELELAEVQRRQEPRSLDFKEFVQSLKGKPRAEVEILYQPNDPEAFGFAIQIKRWLGEGVEGDGAAWVVSDPKPISADVALGGPAAAPNAPIATRAGAFWGGLAVVLKGPLPDPAILFDEKTPLGALMKAFSKSGVSVPQIGTDPRMRDGVFRIVVGPKP